MVARRFLELLVVVVALSLGSTVTISLADEPKARDDSSATDRYTVPEGDVGELLTFIDGLVKFRAKTVEEFKEHRTRSPVAIMEAAERILKLEKDSGSTAARQAKQIVFKYQIRDLADLSPAEQAAVFADLKAFVASSDDLTENELGLAYTAARGLERLGNEGLAKEAYSTFGDLFASQKDEMLKSYGERMLGIARRLDLPGNEINISGQTLEGEEFDWKSYRGKVVLIDFWATWCAPCVAELPKVKKHYEKYHERGFDVVGISLDHDPQKLESFIKKRDLPWVTLFDGEAGPEHPVAAYYGVSEIPKVILVNREGVVVSMDAHGEELGRHLENLLGPSSEVHAKVE